MNVFNSLGSNYTLSSVLSSLSSQSKHSRRELKDFIEKRYEGKAILTCKGRQAIEIALKQLKLKPQEGVAFTGFTCIAVVEAIEKADLKPIYLDIDKKTLNFSKETLEKKLKEDRSIRAVIIQNTLGYPCDIEGISEVCKKHKLVLIEDLAHSIGTIYHNGVEAGRMGDFTVLSFGQGKVVDGVAGGALIVRNKKYQMPDDNHIRAKESTKERLYPLITFIIRKTYPIEIGKILHKIVRIFRLLPDEMQDPTQETMPIWNAGVALRDLKDIHRNLLHRRTIAGIYKNIIRSDALSSHITNITDTSTNIRFPLFVPDRDKLISKLKINGVYVSNVWYKDPIAPINQVGMARYPKSICPEAEEVTKTIMNLPTHVNVSEKDAEKIGRIVNSFLSHQKNI